MESDQDDDEIFNCSIFADEVIHKGDLVWAPLNHEGKTVMWPAQVTSLNKKEGYTVKMLGRPMKVITVKECTPYCNSLEYESAAQCLDYWDDALAKLKQIMDKETHVIFQSCPISNTLSSPLKDTNGNRSGKRRKLSQPLKSNGYAIGDIIWAKYRNHPIWPARVTNIESNGYLMIQYLQCNDRSIKTASKNISHFDSNDYTSNVEAGINSSLSEKFKIAYKQGYKDYAAQNIDSEHLVPLIPMLSNGITPEVETASPKKGKNQLVHFINRNTDMFLKITQGKLAGHFHNDFMKNNSTVSRSGGLFGSFAKTELEEERVLEAIGLMQHKLSKKNKLQQAYGLNVMLPEAIVRLIMFKKGLSYCKAKAVYEIDVKKVKRKDKLSAREALLNAPVTQEAKEEFEKLSQLKMQKIIQDLQKYSSGKSKCRKKLL